MSSILFPAGIYLLIVYNKNTKTRCEICSKLTIETLEDAIAANLLNLFHNLL